MDELWIEHTLSDMTPEEKVGQLLMIGFIAANRDNFPGTRERVNKCHAGGGFFLSGGQDEIADYVTALQSDAKVPLLIAADFENGTGAVLKEGTRFPRPMTRGWVGDQKMEYELGRITALQAKAVGIRMTASPVLDVNTNPHCPDINIRAYSDNPKAISALAIPYIKGIQDNGVLACGKHFPGNGGGEMDQHICAAILTQSKAEFKKTWLKPYRDAFAKAKLAAIMAAHLEVPALTKEKHPETGRPVPSSLSSEVLTKLLRKEMGFKGLVVSDAMNMGGVTTQFSREEAAVKVIQAGADMLLIFSPWDFEKDYDALLKALKDGRLSAKRVDQAVRNILTAKAKLGLEKDGGLPSLPDVRHRLFADTHEDLSRKILEKAITVLRNRGKVLPVRDIKGKKVMILNTFSPEGSVMQNQGQVPLGENIQKLLEKRGAIVQSFNVTSRQSFEDVLDILRKVPEVDYVFYNFIVAPSWGIGTLIPNHNALRLFMNGLITLGKPVIITAFGDPYILYYCPSAPVYVSTLDEGTLAQETAVKVWLGDLKATGRAPVSLDGIFKRGDGMDT